MEQVELLFKKLNELQAEPQPDQEKINTVIKELETRGHRITKQPDPIDNDGPKDRLDQFEDEGAPDDDFND